VGAPRVHPPKHWCHNDVGLEPIRVDRAAPTLAALVSKEAEMRLIGCDLHASQQSIAMLDRDTGVVVEQTLAHEVGVGPSPPWRPTVTRRATVAAADTSSPVRSRRVGIDRSKAHAHAASTDCSA